MEQVLRDERTRERLVCGEGLGISRPTWDELFGARRERTKGRLRAEDELTAQRFGEVLPARLADSAARIRAARTRVPRR